jgi:Ca-activated chloride channel homolog
MTVHTAPLSEAELSRLTEPASDAGLGTLRTERGNLPLDAIDVRADITGLVYRVELTQDFRNPFDVPLEATYIFPLPDRAGVTGMRMTADDRVVEAELRERGSARQAYERAVAAGQRASIAEEERPDVFTMRVGNILPGETVTVALTMVGPMPYEDGAATFRFPLVVAPRYIPGTPLPGESVGGGYAPDTDQTPDASRITPPVLLPGFPHPVRLSVDVGIDPAGLALGEVRSSLHTVSTVDGRVTVRPGERANRDFVLRLSYAAEEISDSLVLVPDAGDAPGAGDRAGDEGDEGEGTYQLTVLPPAGAGAPRPRDVVLVLDRSGSMGGWKMVAARRAAARIVDTLTPADRFAVLTFDDRIDRPDGLPSGLAPATDRHRYRAVEHLARADARGGTELLAPMREALRLLTAAGAPTGGGEADRDRVLVLVTDGQVGNEDHILRELTPGLRAVRVHTVGIDQAVNAGFLGRLATVGGGRCELVESEDRLDAAMDQIHRRIGAPLVTRVSVAAAGFEPLAGTRTPDRMPDLFPGVPLVITGRHRGGPAGSMTITGTTRDGRAFTRTVQAVTREAPALAAAWARAHLRDLEDRYVAHRYDRSDTREGLEQRIVARSLRFGVLCRFTAYVAVDTRVVTDGAQPHRVVQPVEPAAGWDMLAAPPVSLRPVAMSMAAPAGLASPAMMPPLPAPGAPAPGLPGAVTPKVAGAGRALTDAVGRFAERLRGAGAAGGGADPGQRAEAGKTGKAAPGEPLLPPTEPSALREAREYAAEEARRLRAESGRPVYERGELLSDLATRLHAYLRSLAGTGLPARTYAPLAELAEALGRDGDVEAVWAYALRVLEEFGRTGPGEAGGAAPDRSRTFWKTG